MEHFVKRYGNQEYDYFTDTFTFEIIEMYDVECEDERGTYFEILFKTIDTIKMTNSHIKRDYPEMGFIACKQEIEQEYNFNEWTK